ncbi:efflux RND transporter periplasmic adaptor subunit [Acidocella aminolytica]|uniref:efflux RND transporter periplasmic adaptor subunit n=1 Tax=Acidocella aminolytica TaxID=33998 RepID=UPI00222E06EF|nr:efflux RND transporter periplasmic adaptor subunit [Acidocella aminolytica]
MHALGIVNSLGQTTLTATITGKIQGPFDTEGAVAAGAIVAHNVSPALQAQLASARAQLKYANIALKRTLALAHEKLQTDLDVALAQRNQAQAESSLVTIQQQANEQVMRAPFAGTLHYLVAPGTVVYRGTPVATINGRAVPWVDIKVSPATSHDIKLDEEAEVSDGTWHGMGHVLSIGKNARSWGLIQIRIKLPVGSPLIPGEWARVKLIQDGAPATTVPRTALIMHGGKAVVFIITQHHAKEVPVQILADTQKKVWVKGPLKASERIAISGVTRLKNDSRVVMATAQDNK